MMTMTWRILWMSPAAGATTNAAEGGLASTVTDAVASSVFPLASATVSVTVYVPAAPYVCDAVGLGGGPSPPSSTVWSPNDNVHDAIASSGSELAEPSNDTSSGTVPEDGETESDAASAGEGGGATRVDTTPSNGFGDAAATVTVVVASPRSPAASVTVK